MKENYSLVFQLGYYVGDYIVTHYLPTLNIDSLLTRNVIYVSDDEKITFERLYYNWSNKVYEKNLDGTEEWGELRSFRKEMENKYIPKTLQCYVPGFNVENLEDLKEGIIDALWNSDLCHYSVDTEDIEISNLIDYKGNPTEIRRLIKLKRRDKHP